LQAHDDAKANRIWDFKRLFFHCHARESGHPAASPEAGDEVRGPGFPLSRE
jgi:hypothetical protein